MFFRNYLFGNKIIEFLTIFKQKVIRFVSILYLVSILYKMINKEKFLILNLRSVNKSVL